MCLLASLSLLRGPRGEGRRLGGGVLLAASLLAAASVVAVSTSQPSTVTAATATSRYVAVKPARIADTRSGSPVQARVPRDFQITGAIVPANATAAVLNVTATESEASGYLQVFPTGRAAIDSSSTLNLDFAGQTIPNTAFAPLGIGGKVSVFSTFTTDIVIDVFGYFVPATSSTAGRLVPISPTRILDTRVGLGWTRPATPRPPAPSVPANPGDSKNCSDFPNYAAAKAWFDFYFPYYGDIARLDADGDGIPCESLAGAPRLTAETLVDGGATITLQVAGRGGVPTSGVSAVVMNVTVAGPTTQGWVQVAPTPIVKGSHSNLNPERGRTIANLVVVPLGVGGRVDIYTLLYEPGTVDLLADVVGYFTNSTAPNSTTGLFVPIKPTRALDTRQPPPQPKLAAGAIVDINLSRIAPGASAIAGNLTSTGGGPGGFLQLSPKPINPNAASSLNTSYDGQTIANAVVSPVAAGGAAQVYTYGPTYVVLDVTGWFTGRTTTITPPTTDNHRPTADNHRPTADNHRPTAHNDRPANHNYATGRALQDVIGGVSGRVRCTHRLL
jgi:hypothetical protein